MPVTPSIDSAIAFRNRYSPDVCLSDEDEDYIRDKLLDKNEDDDEGQIFYDNSSDSEAELDSDCCSFSYCILIAY